MNEAQTKLKPSVMLSYDDEIIKALISHYINNEGDVKKFYKKSTYKYIKEFYGTNFYSLKEVETVFLENVNAVKKEIINKNNIESIGKEFKFIDLFAGIGGFRLAMQELGGKCIYSSELDSNARKTYYYNYGEFPFGDITKELNKKLIPTNFDVLCAGFPCQAFSIAGKRGGFEDTRGTLFFEVAEIIKTKQPKAIFLENVKGLRSHDKGRTLKTILNVLRNDLGYYVPEPEIVNARFFGVPQNRERIYIAGFRRDLSINDFSYPEATDDTKKFIDIKEGNVVPTKYYLSERYLQTLKNHRARHELKGNGFGYSIVPDNGVANAIVVGGMGRERNLVIDNRITDFTPTTNIVGVVNKEGVRKMTPREWARLQGFPDNFIIPVSDTSAYKQFGNSVAVPAIKAMGEKIINKIGISC